MGGRRELFVDRFLIDRLDGATLIAHQPVDRGPVIAFDKPWEGIFSAYATVIHDGPRYRMYYRGMPGDPALQVTCYAESPDGINWTKPELGLLEVNGSRANNVILLPAPPSTEKGAADEMLTHNFAPMLDTNPAADPAQRFKALAGDGHALYALASADGVRWSKVRPEPVIQYKDPGKPDPESTEISLGPFAFDSQNVPFWSESEKKYLVYARIWVFSPGTPDGRTKRARHRTIGRAESDDFVNWTALKPMIYSDTGTAVPSCDLYVNQTHPYFRATHLYLSTAARFLPGRRVLSDEEAHAIGVHPKYFRDTSDSVLMSSRGGYVYDRTFLGAFSRPGIGSGNWVSRSNYPARNIVQTGENEMSVYIQKEYAQRTAHMNRYSLRLDGLGSVSAGFEGGEMLTKPLRFEGSRLRVNFATSAAGGVRIEIQDEQGQPIPGYGLDDCRELIGDDIERVVSWSGGPDVSALSGRVVRLRFVLKDADLFALRFSRADAPSVASAPASQPDK